MKIASKILKRLSTDRSFRLDVARDSGLSESGILLAVNRAKKGGQSLTKLKTLQAISKHSGLTIGEIVIEKPETVNS